MHSIIRVFLFTLLGFNHYTYAEVLPIKVGVVPQFETKKLHKIWRPILAQLENDTGLQFELVGSANILSFEKDLLAGKFDLAYVNPYQLLLANESHGYLPILRDHDRKLQGILVARKDSGITSIEQLKNQTLAFPSPNAFGASLQIRAELQENHNINIKPLYVRTHDSVYVNVYLKQAIAGGGVSKTLNRQSKTIRDALTIIYKSKAVAPHPLITHPRIPKTVRNKITDSFLKMSTNEQTKNLLNKIPMTKIGQAVLSDYDVLKQMNLQKYFVED